MGIAISGITSLFLEIKRAPFSGKILQLGRQDIYFDFPTLQNFARIAGIKLSNVESIGHRFNQWRPKVETLDDITFFKLIGFDEVESVDVTDYENPSFTHDFNFPIGSEHFEKYDLVYDGGSLEHIFHIPCALSNVTKLLKNGGRIVHESPLHNYIDHGFYQFCPGFFHDYYEANKFSDIRCRITGLSGQLSPDQIPKVFDYTPGQLESISTGGFRPEIFLGCDILANFVVATKTQASTGNEIPVQRRYRNWWNDEKFHNKS